MDYSDLRYDDKVSKSNMVKVACSMQDVELLKKTLPTPEMLVEYCDMNNGGSFLHTLMYANGDNPVDFLNSVVAEYNLDKNIELKKQLFLKRNSGGKYAADFPYIEKYMQPQARDAFSYFRGKGKLTDLVDRRSEAEKNKVKLYSEIKEQIKSFIKDDCQKNAKGISQPFRNVSDHAFDSFPVGTPVSDGSYLTNEKGEPAFYVLGSVQEEYPEIRLLNYGDPQKGEADDVCVLRGMKTDSKESLLSQAIDKMDFPEDFGKHFTALNVFEDDYKRLRKDEAKNATYRYFNQNRGAVVFESEQQKIDANSAGAYGGYMTRLRHFENDKAIDYPIVVIDSSGYLSGLKSKYKEDSPDVMNNKERPLYHELFHAIDLGAGRHFSEMPIFKYAMMLEENNPNGKCRDIFDVLKHYDTDSYNLEAAAFIMGMANKDVFKESPLLSKVYELGECFAVAKANGDKGALSRMETAMDRSPFNTKLRAKHLSFMLGKQQKGKFQLDESERQSFERHVIQRIDQTIGMIKNNQHSKTIDKGREM